MGWVTLAEHVDWPATVSAAVALVSLAFNFIVVRRQGKMQLESVRIQADAAIFEWGRECVDTISRAIEYAGVPSPSESEAATERSHLRWKLSSLVDQGRMFFPNDAAKGEAQMGKNPGWRPAVLDAVAFAHFMIRDEDKLGDFLLARGRFLRECRRLFYTEVQKATDPRARARMLKRLRGPSKGDGMNDFQRALAQRLEEMLPGTLERFQERTGRSTREPPDF